jgi:hypothetical protein
MNATAHSYRLTQTYVLLWVAGLAIVVLGLFVFAPGVTGVSAQALPGLLLLVACVGGALLCLGRMVVEVHAREVRWHFGYVGWPAWSQPLAEVAGTQVVRTRFVRGAGIRGSLHHRFYTVSPGGLALCLHLHDGRTVTLGTPDPQALAAAIDAQRRMG